MTIKSGKLAGLAEFLEEQDIVSLIRLNLVLFIGIAAVGLIGYAVVRDSSWAHFAINGILLIIGSLVIVFMLNRKWTALAAYSSLAIYSLILFYSAWTGAGVKGTTYSLFFLLVVGAALFVGRRAGYITAMACMALGLVLLAAERAGLLVNIDRPVVGLVSWVTLSVCFFLAAHIVGLVLKQAERALAKAQEELAERIRAEAEVRRLNSQLEKALGEEERRFRRVFEVSPVAIVITTLDEGRIINANGAYWKLSGHDPIKSIGKSTTELREGYDAGKRQEFINALVEKKSIKNPNYVFEDDFGRDHFTLAFFELIELEGQPVILSMFSDVTEQVEAQNALRDSEMRERGLLNAVPDAIFELRRDGMVLQFIPSDELSSRTTSEDLLERSIHEIMPEPIPTQIMFAVERALESGQLHIIEYRLVQDGIEKTYESRVAVSGEDTTLMIVRDISLHKWLETEREKLITELDAKSSELERFTYAVSHDLKSPLITVKGFLGFLKQDMASGNAQRVQADIQRMGDATEIMQRRLDDILELSRVGQLTHDRTEIRFNDLVAEVLELVHGRISQGGISVHVDENLPTVSGDRQRLLEVVQNLIDNAAKFMGDQKSPLIEIGQRGEDNHGNPIFFVKDNGMGIAPEYHEKIFGIFNKLDPQADGTGIGLSLVKKIIETHGGRIWVESEAGKGSTFCFTLTRG